MSFKVGQKAIGTQKLRLVTRQVNITRISVERAESSGKALESARALVFSALYDSLHITRVWLAVVTDL